MDEINNINNNFGGATNAQNLTKSRYTIFESKIIGINGDPSNPNDRKNWYEENYIISRYKTLTGKQKNSIYGNNEIRYKDNYDNVLKYYEFMEFKKAEFKCTGINYDDDTGRVIGMDFEIKE